jgi:hypothetical protein
MIPGFDECPWPEDIFRMTIDQYVASVPDPKLRTAISGCLMRETWQRIERHLGAAIERSACRLVACADCSEAMFCFHDETPVCEVCEARKRFNREAS